MADQYNEYATLSRGNAIDNSVDYDPASDAAVTTDNQAYPNHGIDGRSGNDAAKGGVLGAVGGAAVGFAAGGPVGAVIGAVVGGIASDAGVAAVDRVDNDNSPGERNNTVNASDAYATNSVNNRGIDAVVDTDGDYGSTTGTGHGNDLNNDDLVENRTVYVQSGAVGIDDTSEYNSNGSRIR